MLCLFPINLLAAPKITASIRPLQSIIANLTEGVKDPKSNKNIEIDLIVEQNKSLHSFQLKPRKIMALQGSDLLIIIDRNFEIFLDKTFKSLSPDVKIIEVSKLPGVELLRNLDYEEDKKHEGEEYIDEEAKDHHHHHHHVSMYDYHLWLDIDVVKNIATGLANILMEYDSVNQSIYQQNLVNFIHKLDILDTKIKNNMFFVQDQSFIVVHNAYNYFIKRYGLSLPSSITIDHDYNIGARRLLGLQKQIKEEKIKCIFEENEYDSHIVFRLQEGSNVKIGKLDAEWGPINASTKDAYLDMMSNLSDSFSKCLK